MMRDKEYNHKEAEKLAIDISNRVRDNVKDLNIPSYKIVVQTVIGEIGGQGVRIASKSLWDDKNDNWASYTYSNVSSPLSISLLHSLFINSKVVTW
jgi:hypothetical protein